MEHKLPQQGIRGAVSRSPLPDLLHALEDRRCARVVERATSPVDVHTIGVSDCLCVCVSVCVYLCICRMTLHSNDLDDFEIIEIE